MSSKHDAGNSFSREEGSSHLNEDLAATAVRGTQMLHTVGRRKFGGVTGLLQSTAATAGGVAATTQQTREL